MSITAEVTGGFGYEICAEELQRLADKHSDDTGTPRHDIDPSLLICSAPNTEVNDDEYDDEYDDVWQAPKGFQVIEYSEWDCPPALLIVIPNSVLNDVLRGRASFPDMTPLHEFAKEHGIQFTKPEPEIMYRLYEY